MTTRERFVRILPFPDDPGGRIRVEYSRGGHGAWCIADEDTHSEQVTNPDCNFVKNVACINMDTNITRWLRDTLIELCNHLGIE